MEISVVITKGTTPLDKSWSGPINYIRTESIDINSGNITQTACTALEEHEGYLKRSQLKKNDILFSIVGTLGRVGLVKSSDLPANTNQQISIVRLKEEDPKFIFNSLKSPKTLAFINSETTTSAQPSLSLWQIKKMEINIPKYKEQQQIGIFFNQLDNLITLQQCEPKYYIKEEKSC